METENKNSDEEIQEALGIKETILRKIGAQEVSMRPKKYFVLKAVALIALAVVVLAISAFIFNFISFNLRVNNHGDLLFFGPQGFWLFLKVFPWGLLAIDIALAILLEWLLRKFRFAYRLPALYLFLALFAAAGIIGFTADHGTPLNDRLLHQADMHHLPPPLNNFYTESHQPPEGGECDCVITAIDGTTLMAHERGEDNEQVTILVPPGDPLLPTLRVGDTIFAGGDFHDGVLHAFGLRQTVDN